MRAIGAAGIGMACGLAFLIVPDTGRADAIDGDWCHKNGKRLSIRGPGIVTPGGTAMSGDYDRHAFAYVVPPGEPGAGKRMVLVLMDEDTVEMGEGVTRFSPKDPAIWKRCSTPTS